MENNKTVDYSGKFSLLKKLLERKTGRNFSDEEFNEIFRVGLKTTPRLTSLTDKFQNDTIGLLLLFEEATRKWEEGKSIDNVKGNLKDEIKNIIDDLRRVIDYYANEKNPNWGTVGTLANIHESLGERLYDNYDKHLGYSKTIEEGLKRHSEASEELLSMMESDLEKIDNKIYRSGLLDLKLFFEELLSTFEEILPKIRTKAAMKKDEKFYHHTMMAGYYEIQEKKLWDTISDFNSSSDSGLRKATELMEKKRQKMSSRAEFHLREKKEIFNPKIHGRWNDTIPSEEEARAYGEKFLKTAQRLIGRKLSKQEQKKYNKTYKYASGNPKIKVGTIVLDKKGMERTIAEASDKVLRLEGDKDWIATSEVRFKS